MDLQNAADALDDLDRRHVLARSTTDTTHMMGANETAKLANDVDVPNVTAKTSTTPEGHQYGQRLLVSIVDQRARDTPDAEWISISRSREPSDGWRPVTYAMAAAAIDRMAHMLAARRYKATASSPKNPRTGQSFPAIVYMTANDARYLLFSLACVKAGLVALLVSPRNNLEADLNLLNETGSPAIWYDESFAGTAETIMANVPGLDGVLLEPLHAWLTGEVGPRFPYTKTVKEAEWDPLVVVHTSGTTGMPKPVVTRNGTAMNFDKLHNMQPMGLLEDVTTHATRLFVPMPLYHTGGWHNTMMMTLLWDVPMDLPTGERPISTDLVLECLQYGRCDAWFGPVAMVEEMAALPGGMEAMARLKYILTGGELSTTSLHRLMEGGVSLRNMMGQSEFFPFPSYAQPDTKLWHYFEFDEEAMGIEWRVRDPAMPEDMEMCIVRKGPDPGMQSCFYCFPELEEYTTRDLFRRHPTMPHMWAHAGRADDTLVLSLAEKFNPVDMETTVANHERVKGALVVGEGRNRPALLVEPMVPPRDDDEVKALLDDIWPTVEKANKMVPGFGRIGRELILVASSDKPFHRTMPKNNVSRGPTARLFAAEINALYEAAGDAFGKETSALDVSSVDALDASLRTLFETRLGVANLTSDTDFFAAGIDSTQVIRATHLIRHGLEAAGVSVPKDGVPTRAVYRHPTTRDLARHMFEKLAERESDDINNINDAEATDNMKALLDKYSSSFPSVQSENKPRPAEDGQVIVITGTTGALGSYMLDLCLRSPRVRKVVCLNRAEDGLARQTAVFGERGLSCSSLADGAAEFLHADLSIPDLGLGLDVYNRLLTQVDRVVHNSWPVNFNMPVLSFEPHIRGVRHLIDFSAAATKAVPIVFISSIGEVGRWPAEKGLVPESPIADLSVANPMGYGRSKLVASILLDRAPVPTASVRVGQIAGPSSEAGFWNRQEWLPSIVASSVYLGLLPRDLGCMSVIDWIPVEEMAAVILEVSGITAQVPLERITGRFHGVNPNVTDWADLAPVVQAFYGHRIKKLVSFEEWVDALEASQHQDDVENVRRNPGVKLLDAYKMFSNSWKPSRLATSRTEEYSQTMRDMKVVTPALMETWCRQWDY